MEWKTENGCITEQTNQPRVRPIKCKSLHFLMHWIQVIWIQVFNLTQHAAFTFAKELLEGEPGQGAADLQPLGHNCGGDEFVVGNFFVQFVVGRLVEEYQVVELIPHFSFGPLLLRTRETCSFS